MKISIVIITLNEEKHIGKCLENVKWADDIIIMDSYSGDRTVEIAKKYTDRIYQVGKVGTGKIKNLGIEKAKNLWVINLDADERIPDNLRKEIGEVLKDPKYDGYYIPRKCFVGNKWIKYAGQWPDYQLRLFMKDRGKFQEKLVHERLILNGGVGRMKNHMIHYNYDSWHHYFNKSNWYSTREAEDLLRKKLVWMYPWDVIKNFFRKYRAQRKGGNSIVNSYIMARSALDRYELKWTIPFKPLFAFIRFYFVQQGFRDGVHGLMWALAASYNRIMKYSKYHDMKRGGKKAYENLEKI
ncbi:MAG: glycosyltransferase family 2 protein [Candidatus Aenigmarchaeota archaeon]